MLNMKGSLVLWFWCVIFFFCATGDGVLGNTVTLEDISERMKQRFEELDEFLQNSVADNIAAIDEKLEAMNKKQDDMNQRLNGFNDLREKLDGLSNSQNALMEKVEDAELRDESLKEDISSLKQGCQSQLESLNTTLVDLITDIDVELKTGSLKGDISSLKEDAEMRDKSLKEDISSMKEGCQSQLESLNTTLVDLLTDIGCQPQLESLNTTSEIKIGKPQELFPANCQEVLHSCRRQSGVYKIFPVGMPGGVNVYCDQDTEGGGWIVFLQRQQQTPQVDFVKPFADYAKGFGEPSREFWLGNRALHAITGRSQYELRVEATNIEGESRQATWATFSVGSEDTQYTLTVTDYNGSKSTLGDGMSGMFPEVTTGQSNQMKFSTYDKDTENGCSSGNGRVGWWFHSCFGALPTAAVIGKSSSPTGLNWYLWEKNYSSRGYTYLSWVQLKIRGE